MYVNCIYILHMDFWFLTIEYVLMQPLSITMSVVKSHLNKVERPHRALDSGMSPISLDHGNYN